MTVEGCYGFLGFIGVPARPWRRSRYRRTGKGPQTSDSYDTRVTGAVSGANVGGIAGVVTIDAGK